MLGRRTEKRMGDSRLGFKKLIQSFGHTKLCVTHGNWCGGEGCRDEDMLTRPIKRMDINEL